MRKLLIVSVFFFLLFTYGLVLSLSDTRVVPEELEPSNYPGFFDYRGALNVHTDRSRGSGSPSEVIQAAQESGLDFLFITDHNIFDFPPIPEGYHRQLLVMSGASYSYLDSRLLLFDRHRRHRIESLGQAQVLMADLLSQSGPDADPDLVILAHPFKQGFTWTGAVPTGLDGLEVINLKSIWQQAWNDSKLSFVWSAIIYPFNSHFALLRLYTEPRQELALWDKLSMSRSTIGFAGSDATAKTGGGQQFSARFPSYQTSFGLISNHVLLRSELTGEPEGDRRKILTALAGGQFYMSLNLLGNPKGFAAYIQDGEKVIPMGSRVKWHPGMKLVANVPRKPRVPIEVALIKDGQHIQSWNSLVTEYEIQGKGVYRLIVRVFPTLTLPDGQRWMTWIYTNPFYVD
jgi:hypothetical protein